MSITELLGGAIGVMLLGFGVAPMAGWMLHRPRRHHALLFFGLWCACTALA